MSVLDLFGNVTAPSVTYQDDPEPTGYSALPAYLRSADNHNIANGNFSFTDPSSWIPAVEKLPKFIQAATLSGVNSFYNTGVAVNNFFGGNAEERDTAAWIGSIDNDLGMYYEDNRQSADLVGFIAGSFIPGIGGVKVLNAGMKVLNGAAKEGFIGRNLQTATNLLTPSNDFYIKQAARDIAQSQAQFSITNTNVLKALGAGVGSAALESAAFEVAVAATMFKSPILEDMDVKDITLNALMGVGVGAAVGGVFNAARTYSGIKRTISEVDKELMPISSVTQLPDTFRPADKIIQAFHDRDRVANAEIISKTILPDGIERARARTLNNLDNNVRSNFQALANGDAEIANMFADGVKGMDTATLTNVLSNATEIGKVSTPFKVESKLRKFLKSSAAKLLNDSDVASPTTKVGYVKLSGEGRGGQYFDEVPKVLNIADEVKSPEDVMKVVASKKFREKDIYNFTRETAHQDAEARYIWASRVAKVTPDMSIGATDIPLLEKALETFGARQAGMQALENPSLNLRVGDMLITNTDDLYNHIKQTKIDLATEMLASKRAGNAITIDEIAKVTNVRKSYLDGQVSNDEFKDLFARQFFQEQHTKELVSKGLWSTAKGLYPTDLKPTWAKVAYDTSDIPDNMPMIMDGMAQIAAKYKTYHQGVQNAVSSAVGEELFQQLIPISDEVMLTANRYGSQAGLISYNNANYDTLGSVMQSIGAATSRIEKKFMNETVDTINPHGAIMLAKPQVAREFSVTMQKLAASPEHYVIDEATSSLIPLKVAEYNKRIAAGERNLEPPRLHEGTVPQIRFENPETLDALRAHRDINGARVTKERNLRSAQGLEDSKNPQVVYPVRKNLADYKHFAFVVDDKVTGTGHVSMIHAATANELEQLMAKVPSEFRVVIKKDSEDYHRALGDYEYSRTLNNNYIDTELKRRGIDSDFFPMTDPQKIVNNWIEDQTRRDKVLAKELVRANYEKQFLELESLGERYTGIAASQYATSLSRIENTVNNPYANYVKTALNISSINEHPLLYGFNNLMDRAFTGVTRAVGNLFSSAKSPAELETINAELQRYGIKSAYYDAATDLLANHTAPRGDLMRFIRGANSIISTLVLRTDPLNALNNAVGSNVLVGAETSYIVNSIKRGDTNAVGRLAELGKLKLPGTQDIIRSPSKLIGEAYKEFITGDIESIKAFYKSNGWSASIIEQHRAMLDDLTVRGSESSAELQAKMSNAFTKAKDLFETVGNAGERITGNRIAEEMNRFVSAHIMKRFTDVAESAGIISPQESLAMINTFVNRTQGNILASQRPLIFQGPVGSAIGLFQSYQFNLMQQLFRYVGEGKGKDAAMLLGLQGTIYGMQGLPAFNAINTHIIGTASGNAQHRDLYDATYGLAGKEAGDFLMYGLASNLIKTNLYTRGDINPRQASVIPINPVDVPAINAIGRVFSNVKEISSNIAAGANVWETLIQGVEHNGFSRPLAGLAQVMQAADPSGNGLVYSTNNRGEILGSNDLFSLATLSRLAGGKPIDEAIVNDRSYTISVYQAADRAKLDRLREAIKTSVVQGNVPSNEQYTRFAEEYSKLGGKSRNFNKFMIEQYKKANTPAAERIANDLSNPLSQSMQNVMGGVSITEGAATW